MEAARELVLRIRSLGEILRLVGAMRSLAATHAQQASGALASLRTYATVIEAGLGRLCDDAGPAEAPAPAGPRLLVAFASEHGFAGAFNALVLERAGASLTARAGTLAVVGARGALAAPEHGLRAVWTAPMAASLKAATLTAQQLIAELDQRFARGEAASVDVLFGRYASGRLELTEQRLVPVDLRRFRGQSGGTAPITQLPAPDLSRRLAREYFFAELLRVVVESLAAENEARLHSMELAHHKVEERLGELRLAENRVRQDEVTTELLDLVTGAAASR